MFEMFIFVKSTYAFKKKIYVFKQSQRNKKVKIGKLKIKLKMISDRS